MPGTPSRAPARPTRASGMHPITDPTAMLGRDRADAPRGGLALEDLFETFGDGRHAHPLPPPALPGSGSRGRQPPSRPLSPVPPSSPHVECTSLALQVELPMVASKGAAPEHGIASTFVNAIFRHIALE